jgi:hypothetical protein
LRRKWRARFSRASQYHQHPVIDPRVSHFMQVPLRDLRFVAA